MLKLRQNVTAEGERHKEAVRSSVADNSSFDQAYVVMNVLATIVASYGLLADSAAVVIGAMVIAMLLGPISGMGLALVDGNSRLLRKASTAIVGGVLVVFVTALVIGFFNKEVPAARQMMERTSPNLFDLMIALGGGAAGAYAVISPRLSVAFVGVAIATALVPPLSTCGMFLARGEFALSGGAFLLTLANIVGIQCACSVVFYLNGFRDITKGKKLSRGVLVEDLVSVAVLLVLGGVLTTNLHGLVAKELYERAVRNALKADLVHYPGAYLADVRLSRTDGSVIVRALVRGPVPFSAQQIAEMESTLPAPRGQLRSELRVRYVHTTVMTGKGPLFSPEDIAPGYAE
jgi:uncharacterized hydrophobic protein (TIGR00271 family)